MLIGFDTGPCVVSLRNRSLFSSKIKSKWFCALKLCAKIIFSLFFSSFKRNLGNEWESTAVIFRQSSVHVFQFPLPLDHVFLFTYVTIFTLDVLLHSLFQIADLQIFLLRITQCRGNGHCQRAKQKRLYKPIKLRKDQVKNYYAIKFHRSD